MLKRIRNALFALALLLATAPPVLAQQSADVGAVFRTLAARVPELPSVVVLQPRPPALNSWIATSQILNIMVDVAGSAREAEWKLHQSFIVPATYDREEVFKGRALYVWERYGLRLSYQAGPYVIHIGSRDGDPRVGINEPLAMKVLEHLVGELESAAPKRQVLRARDLPLNSAIDSLWGAQSAFFREKNLEVLPWEDAEFILIDRKLQGGRQYQTRWLTIFSADGEGFLTLQTELDAYAGVGKARGLDLTGFASE